MLKSLSTVFTTQHSVYSVCRSVTPILCGPSGIHRAKFIPYQVVRLELHICLKIAPFPRDVCFHGGLQLFINDSFSLNVLYAYDFWCNVISDEIDVFFDDLCCSILFNNRQWMSRTEISSVSSTRLVPHRYVASGNCKVISVHVQMECLASKHHSQ